MVLYFPPLRELAGLATRSELYSHVPLIPLVTLFVLALERRQVFALLEYDIAAGVPVALAGLFGYGFLALSPAAIGEGMRLTAAMVSAWLVIVGGFIAFFGRKAARAGIFPLAFLAFAIPLPPAWVERIVAFLLWGSGAFTELFFKIFGVTFLREGSVFHLGRTSIEIAPECSGIRSSLALFITTTIAARMFLRRWWSRSLLLLAVVPLAMIKNAIRIVTLTLLAEYVDMRFLTGHWLHRSGGFVFFGITLLLLGGILLLLRKMESGGSPAKAKGAPADADVI